MRAYDNPMLSMSRISTAICARLAASATSVKSLRKASVDEPPLICIGCCGGAILAKGDCCVEDLADACCALENDDEEFMVT